MRAILDPTSETPRLVEGDRNALDSMASDQDLSERVAHQLTGIGGEALDEKKERLYIKGKGIANQSFGSWTLLLPDFELQCTTDGNNFSFLNSVKLVIYGYPDEERKVLSLESHSPKTWRQTLPVEL